MPAIEKKQSLTDKLAEIRESKQGIITYHFEKESEVLNKETDQFEIVKTISTQQQPINDAVFYNEKGKFEKLENVAQIFKDTAHDLGAKYFTL